MSARILVVEDEQNLALGIQENLQDEGHEVEVAVDGEAGLARALAEDFDLVVLDVMMPKLDGYAVCEALRAAKPEVLILFLTAKGGVDDRIHGLERGGDDYLAKPFSLRELLLRVGSLLRRKPQPSDAGEPPLSFGGNTVDLRGFHAKAWDGQEHHLQAKEVGLLRALAARPGEVVTREEVLEAVWGNDPHPGTRVLAQLMEGLCARLERDPQRPVHLTTVRGVGFCFRPEA
ncbi:MAG: response regulator transcription factor [Planctomycetes bacterium]|nr:response regulator transcription factor [Planctomycetota bacterium]